MTSEYEEFLKSKVRAVPDAGFEWDRRKLPRKLFDWQKDVTQWALRKGRAALFLDTGLGKSFQSLAWGGAVMSHVKKPVLYLCPLAVGPQTVREAEKFGVKGVRLASSSADVVGPGVYVTNYHKWHKFGDTDFGGVIRGEASIIKDYTGQFRNDLIARFASTPYRLTETATPSPNDVEEIGNQAEFLGVCTRIEMLATYFYHNSGNTSEWALKPHAEESFWQWVASWAVVMRSPADLGYDGSSYVLPPLRMHEHIVESDAQTGRLFAVEAETLAEQRKARRASMADRVRVVADLVNASDEQWVVWCELNDEGDALARAIPDAVQIAGKDDDDEKVARMEGFIAGKHRVVVTKPSMFGWGLNLQMCHKTAVAGVGHSFESLYQLIRRFWRYGQSESVDVHLVTSDAEVGALENVKRKQRDHDAMFARMLRHTASINRQGLAGGVELERPYNPQVEMKIPNWLKA